MMNLSPSRKPKTPWGWFASFFAVIGALNWGLVGLFNFNLVRSLFGPMSVFSRLIYTLVGLSGLYLLYTFYFHDYRRESRRSGITKWWR